MLKATTSKANGSLRRAAIVAICAPILFFVCVAHEATLQFEQPLDRVEMYKMLKTKLPQSPYIVEIGVWQGNNSQDLWYQLTPSHLALCDLWANTKDDRYKDSNEGLVRERFRAEILKGQVTVRKGLSLDCVLSLPAKSVHMLYLDTVHDYELTKKELEQAGRIIAPAGYLCGHDFVQPMGREKSYGVIAAVIEFSLQNNWRLTHVSREQHRSFCLRRRSASSASHVLRLSF
jgi:hypothetical protein